jgi:hypothetical protein
VRIRRWLDARSKASGIQPPRGRASTRSANSLRPRATPLLLVAAGLLMVATIVSVGSTLVLVPSATATPPPTGYGFAYSDDGVIVRDPQYVSDPGLGDPLYGLSTSITAFRPKAFRFTVPYNAVEVPAEVDRAKAIINRAKQRGVTEIFVSFRQKAGEFATGWTRPGPQSWRDLIRRFMNVPNGTKPDGTPKTIDNDVTMWSPAAQPNDGTGWLSYSPVAPSTVERVRLLAGYYKELAAELASRGSADKLVSPEFHDVKWDSPSEYHPKCS